MLEMVGAVDLTAVYAVLVGVLVAFSPRIATKVVVFAAAAAWGAIIVAIAAGGLAAGPVPVPVVASAILIALLFAGWRVFPEFRTALLAAPLPVLVAVNAARLGGVFFVILTATGRLSAPFGPAAGWGDIVVGALAVPIAIVAVRGGTMSRGWIGAWNALGVLDLVNAIVLGALSAPGTPIRVFMEGPGTLAMGNLPWIMVPAMLVPLFLLVHFTVAVKLAAGERAVRVAAPAAA